MRSKQALFSLGMAALAVMQAEAQAFDSVEGHLRTAAERKNLYASYTIPPRGVLLQNAPSDMRQLLSQETPLLPKDCGWMLYLLGEGFKALYPNGPHIHGLSYIVSWERHVAMVHFSDLYLCSVRERLKKTLAAIADRGLKFDPLPQRINIITIDVDKHANWPKHVRELHRRLHSAMSDLIWLSYQGYPPAMLELAKLSARDDVIRLTPRFAFYLLSVSDRAGLTDPALPRLLANVRPHLSAKDRTELASRITQRRWPRSERMVVD